MSKKKNAIHNPGFLNNRNINIGLAIIAFCLYANTLNHGFALDDAIVISQNEFTQNGFSGLVDIFTKDTFHGFFGEAGKDKLLKGGRYRPFTLAMFAIEKAIFGNSPFIHHLINILIYCLTGIVVFLLGKEIGKEFTNDQNSRLFALGLALLYIAHPIHTEAVANIKGRDELMAFLGSIVPLYLLAKHRFKNINLRTWMFAGISFFIALLSKENSITFLAIFPLVGYIVYKKSILKAIKVSLTFIGIAAIFIAIRTVVIGWDMGSDPSMELMNNPYLKIENNQYISFTFSEKLATIFFTLYKYLQLLIFPHPLTHDYYPYQIPMKVWSDPMVILSLMVHIGLILSAVIGILKRKIWGLLPAYYLITLSIFSNIIFPIGTHMSERFLYMPGMAFCAGLSYLLMRKSLFKVKNLGFGILGIIILLYGYKTIDRNKVWRNNFKLFTTDALISTESAKANNAAGGVLLEDVPQMPDGPEKTNLINRAHQHLNKAVSIHPNYVNAFLLNGNAYFYENKYEEAIRQYEQCLRIDPDYQEARNNIFLTYRSAGRYFGETQNNLTLASQYLQKALALRPDDFETNRLLGTCNGIIGQHSMAVKHFLKCAELEPNNAGIFVSLGKAYQLAGNPEAANEAFSKAQQINPSILQGQ